MGYGWEFMNNLLSNPDLEPCDPSLELRKQHLAKQQLVTNANMKQAVTSWIWTFGNGTSAMPGYKPGHHSGTNV
jgi:hypothetical protein